MAIQDAKKIYCMIAEAKNETDTKPEPDANVQRASGAAPQSLTPSGPTGPQPYVPPLLKAGTARNAPKAVPAAEDAAGIMNALRTRLFR